MLRIGARYVQSARARASRDHSAFGAVRIGLVAVFAAPAATFQTIDGAKQAEIHVHGLERLWPRPRR